MIHSLRMPPLGTPVSSASTVASAPECLIAGLPPQEADWIAAEARAFGLLPRTVAITHLDTVNRDHWSAVMLVINVDAFDLVHVVDTLIEFRRNSPEVSVIILSGAFGGDEFQGERKAICDVSLRLPLSSRRLQRAVREIQCLQTAV